MGGEMNDPGPPW